MDQEKLAWGAYDAEGNLVWWGPISSGRDKCSDSNRSCRTLTGIFRVFSKENEKCTSDVFPIGKGGAKMPYCMYFHKGLPYMVLMIFLEKEQVMVVFVCLFKMRNG